MHNILIIDDEEDILTSLKYMLDNKGFSTAVLQRPETAFTMINVSKPDILLLDINLAELDGRDICMQLKSNSRTKRMKIILISGYVVNEADYIDYGADDFIEKPINFSSLLKKINHHLGEKANA